jgi:hypothetical protein
LSDVTIRYSGRQLKQRVSATLEFRETSNYLVTNNPQNSFCGTIFQKENSPNKNTLNCVKISVIRIRNKKFFDICIEGKHNFKKLKNKRDTPSKNEV